MLMNYSDWISICGVVMSSIVGIIIATVIQKKSSSSRFLRDFFIKELSDIQEYYRSFINDIWSGKENARNIIDTLKYLSFRIKTIDKYTVQKYKTTVKLMPVHSKFQRRITALDEFNSQYDKEKVMFSNDSKILLMNQHNYISEAIIEKIIQINGSKGTDSFKQKIIYYFHKLLERRG